MEKDEITLLLEKYWKAETTIAEEKAIKEYLAKTGLSDNVEEKDWFKAISETKSIHPKVTEPAGEIKATNKHILFKVAASVILISGICAGGTKYYYHVRAEEEITTQKQLKSDLIFMADALNQGYKGLDESQHFLLGIKPLKK